MSAKFLSLLALLQFGAADPLPDPDVNVQHDVSVKVGDPGRQAANLAANDQECPVANGFFYYPPTAHGQCFKYIAGPSNQQDAIDICKGEGPKTVTLAHPFDAIGLRSHMVQRFGGVHSSGYIWLNARRSSFSGDFQWSDGTPLTLDNPLWWEQPPNGKNCMVLLKDAGDMGTKVNHPFYYTDCISTMAGILCEWRAP